MSESGAEFNADQIKAMIPHRYPFLLIDRVTNAIPDRSAIGIKTVTVNEPYFHGLPEHCLAMPGLLIVEAMAQTLAVVMVQTLGTQVIGAPVYLMGIQDAKFHKPVRPGDTLMLHMVKERSRGPISKVRGQAKVNGEVVTEAALTAIVLDSGIDF
jgi:3-hydroxyacyl-[acyl-carrier-protein] dehydratase